MTLSRRAGNYSSSKLEKELNSLGRVDTQSLVTVNLILKMKKDNTQTIYQGDDLSNRKPCKLKTTGGVSWIIIIIIGGTILFVIIVVVVAIGLFIRRRNRQWDWSYKNNRQEMRKAGFAEEVQHQGEHLEREQKVSKAVRDPTMISSPRELDYENVEELVRGTVKWVNTSQH